MAGSISVPETPIDASGMSVAIIASRFNFEITEGLIAGAKSALYQCGMSDEDIRIVMVPGAFEIPLMLELLSSQNKYDALIALGAVIQGETKHFDYISEAAMRGIAQVSIAHKIPIGCGVLTTFTEEQAITRSRNDEHNKGREAAIAAIEMAHLKRLV
jgi:6,7-dimethyl-8-ribityllumazine synthase